MANGSASNRAKPAGPAGLDRDQVIAAGLAYVDAHGLESFSMRNLARELGVYPTALYWHAGNREALLGEVTALALIEIEPPDEIEAWDDWMCEFGRRFRAMMHRHPNLAPIVGSKLVSSASTEFGIVEILLAKLSEAGFRGDALVDAYNVLVGCTVGFVTLELAAAPDDGGDWAERLEHGVAAVDPAVHPVLAANRERLANRAFGLRWVEGTPLDDSFRAMQRVVLSGLGQMGGGPPSGAGA